MKKSHRSWFFRFPYSLILATIIMVLAIFTRFWKLDTVPSAISHDEIVYAINAQSVALTGTGVSGIWNPLSFTPMETAFAELPSTLMAPFFRLPISAILAARLPFALMSLGIPFLLAAIALHITHRKRTAFFVFLLSLFNPWIWQFGRLSFDPSFSFFFYCLGTVTLLYFSKWNKVVSIVPFILAFYEYQGHKLIFLPWIFIWLTYTYFAENKSVKKIGFEKKTKKDTLWPLITTGVLSTILFVFYLFIQLPQQESAGRLNTILTPKHPDIVASVIDQRTKSLDSPLNRLVVNPYTVWTGQMIQRGIDIYSPRRLFWEGQANNTAFSVWNHGIFYLVDIILIIAGIYALLDKKHKSAAVLLLAGLALMPFPAFIAESNWYIFRPAMVIPFILILAGIGTTYITEKLHPAFTYLITGLYILSLLRFSYTYFVRYPVFSAERHYFTEKILSDYIQREQQDKPVTVYTPETAFPFKTYVFYNDLFTLENAPDIQQAFRTNTFKLESVTFSDECFDLNNLEATSESTLIVRTDTPICTPTGEAAWSEVSASEAAKLRNHLTFPALKDSGEVYALFGDTTCTTAQAEHGTYLRITTLDQLQPKNLSDTDLCHTWITDVRNLTTE